MHGFIATGIVFVIMLFDTEQWRRIVPTSPLVLLQAWNTWVHYATFHLPPEPNGFYGYNALQQIANFAVVFVFGTIAIATGVAMSPAVVNRFPWYARLFGGRQSARSIHFLTMHGSRIWTAARSSDGHNLADTAPAELEFGQQLTATPTQCSLQPDLPLGSVPELCRLDSRPSLRVAANLDSTDMADPITTPRAWRTCKSRNACWPRE